MLHQPQAVLYLAVSERNAALIDVRALNLHLSPNFHQNSPLGTVYTTEEGPAWGQHIASLFLYM